MILTVEAGSSRSRHGGTSIYFTQLGHLKHQASLGDPNAQFLLGNLYYSPPEGTSIERSIDKALDYYYSAAARDHAGAQYNLGVMFYQGIGVPEDKTKAFVWFTLAAENDSPVAKNVKRKAQNSLKDLGEIISIDDQTSAQQRVDHYKQLIKNADDRKIKLEDNS